MVVTFEEKKGMEWEGFYFSSARSVLLIYILSMDLYVYDFKYMPIDVHDIS